MIVQMNHNASPADVAMVRKRAEELSMSLVDFSDEITLRLVVPGKHDVRLARAFAELNGVNEVFATEPGHCLTHRAVNPAGTAINVRGNTVGGDLPVVIAGPCAVESYDQMMQTAVALAELGVSILRGGAFKPRTSPYDFQGLGEEALHILERVRAETGMAFITEATGVGCFDAVESAADIVQIGARNMQNVELLKRAGRSHRPILLKRHFSATIDEFLHAAEYVMAEGNRNVILCERGIRSFVDHARFTLDVALIPALQARTHLPILVDPSHAAGDRHLVIPLARAALAADADGLLVEAHPCPNESACDARQALNFDDLEALMREIEYPPFMTTAALAAEVPA